MSPENLFQIVTVGVIPFWLLLAIFPNWRITHLAVHSVALPVLLGFLYAYLVQRGAFTQMGGIDVFSLDGLMRVMGTKEAFVAGWIHYLAFDLFVGAWMVRDANKRAVWYPYVVPCLFLTYLLGPGGLMFYLMIRTTSERASWYLD